MKASEKTPAVVYQPGPFVFCVGIFQENIRDKGWEVKNLREILKISQKRSNSNTN